MSVDSQCNKGGSDLPIKSCFHHLFVSNYLKQAMMTLLENCSVVLSVGDLCCLPKIVVLMLCFWGSKEVFWFGPSSLSLPAQFSCEVQSLIVSCSLNAFEFLSCLCGSLWFLSFAEWFNIYVVWGFDCFIVIHYWKLFRFHAIGWLLIHALSFAVLSTICPILRLQVLFNATASLSYFAGCQVKKCRCHIENSIT